MSEAAAPNHPTGLQVGTPSQAFAVEMRPPLSAPGERETIPPRSVPAEARHRRSPWIQRLQEAPKSPHPGPRQARPCRALIHPQRPCVPSQPPHPSRLTRTSRAQEPHPPASAAPNSTPGSDVAARARGNTTQAAPRAPERGAIPLRALRRADPRFGMANPDASAIQHTRPEADSRPGASTCQSSLPRSVRPLHAVHVPALPVCAITHDRNSAARSVCLAATATSVAASDPSAAAADASVAVHEVNHATSGTTPVMPIVLARAPEAPAAPSGASLRRQPPLRFGNRSMREPSRPSFRRPQHASCSAPHPRATDSHPDQSARSCRAALHFRR